MLLVVAVILYAAIPAIAGPFQMWVTVSPPGPQNHDPVNWGSVLRYRFESVGAPPTILEAISRDLVADPAGLVFREVSHELLVGNRHGNTGGGSISRFVYDAAADTFIANGAITGNNLNGVHQLALNSVTGELFAANYGGGVSRFLFDAGGHAVANGAIAGSASTRGVAVSPDGRWLFVTQASDMIRRFDLATGEELASFPVPGSAGLHDLRILGTTRLYVADPFYGIVFQFDLGSDASLTNQASIAAPSAVSVTFDPTGQELFATGHLTSHQITRLVWDDAQYAWQPGTPIYPDLPLGDIASLAVHAMIGVPPAAIAAPAHLLPNAPNPFNPQTVIPLRLDAPGQITLRIYDAAGRAVRTLVDAWLPAGAHDTSWNGTDDQGGAVPSGVYLARLTSAAGVEARSLMLVR